MKKTYTKPVIMFESFVLSTSIAAECKNQANFYRSQCGLVVGSGRYEKHIFVDSTMGCTTEVPYDVANQDFIYENQICYHVPYDAFVLFGS